MLYLEVVNTTEVSITVRWKAVKHSRFYIITTNEQEIQFEWDGIHNDDDRFIYYDLKELSPMTKYRVAVKRQLHKNQAVTVDAVTNSGLVSCIRSTNSKTVLPPQLLPKLFSIPTRCSLLEDIYIMSAILKYFENGVSFTYVRQCLLNYVMFFCN